MVQLDLPVLRLMSSRIIAATFATSLLAGCALTPLPTHQTIVDDALPKMTLIPSNWSADRQAAQVADDWLNSFNDPVLDALVAEAIANNLDLRQAAEKVAIARQVVIIAGASLQPHVGAALGGRKTRDADQDSAFDSSSVSASIGWELDVWGRVRAQRSAAESEAEAVALDYAYARQSLAATTAKLWYLASTARQLLAVEEQAVAVYDRQLSLVKTRRSAGKESNLDVVETQAKLAEAGSELESARQIYGETQRALELLLGRYPAAEIEASPGFGALPPAPGAGIAGALLERRPDIIAAERMVLASFRLQESAELALLPAFSFSLTGGRIDSGILSLLRLNPWLASAAIGVSIPIYEGGALNAKVAIATAQQAKAVAKYGAVALAAFAEVENGLANEELLAKRIPLIDEALRNQTEALQIATIQYVAGRRDLLWVSNIQAGQLGYEALGIKLRGAQQTNRIQLLLVLGGAFNKVPPQPVSMKKE